MLFGPDEDDGASPHAQQTAYRDMWDFTDSTRQLVLDFRSELERWELSAAFREFILLWVNMLEQSSSEEKKLLNYLMYMTQRLLRIKQLLKPTGSIYLHCDPTVSHYVKVLMDGIFGFGNFRNEIVWKRMSSHNDAKRWGRIHDSILFYTASQRFTWTREARIPYDPEHIESSYRYEDEKGRYMTSPLQARSLSGGGYEYEWRGVCDTWKFPRHRLDELDANGKIHWPKKAKGVPRRKVYLDETKGVPVQDVVTDVTQKRKATDYPTKKPNKLLERIIMSSTKPGDLVVDPFCGCGTAIEVAHELRRGWIGIDISGMAVDEIEKRLEVHGQYRGAHFDVIEGSPETMAEYTRLRPYEKQDWLIRRLGGVPNPRKSGDRGIDGDLNIHLGIDKNGRERWGRIVFSVKTGKQRKPEHVRELIGTMKSARAAIGVLILDMDPTEQMEEAARKAKKMHYQQRADMPPKEYDCVQMLTAYQIIEGARIDRPPTVQEVRTFREAQRRMQV
jgi:DNA modification methylase